MKSKITGVAWFTAVNTIGIITLTNELGENKAYIGEVVGLSEVWDIILLATVKDLGAKFPYNEAKAIIEKQGQKLNIEY